MEARAHAFEICANTGSTKGAFDMSASPPFRTHAKVKNPQRVHRLLGLELVNPTRSLIRLNHLHPDAPAGPIVVSTNDPSRFYWDEDERMHLAPPPGAMIVVLTFGGFQWSLGTPLYRNWRTPTVRVLAEQILKRALSPRQHQQQIDATARRYVREAQAYPDDPLQQQWRLLAAQTMRIDVADKTRHICGLVFVLPGRGGTQSTWLRLTTRHLREIRAFLSA